MLFRTLLLASLLCAGCTDEDPSPTATVTAATPDTLTPADDLLDDLTITIEYADGDGDLGGGTAEVHDCRGNDLVTALLIPAIAAPAVVEAKTPIAGTLDLHVNDVGALATAELATACADLGAAAPTATETAFCVILVDAAGHRGDGDCTAAITLSP
jgi:hypothetical protein